MTTRIRKVITAINEAGTAFSEVHQEEQVGGKWYPLDPVSLSDEGLGQWAEQFSGAVVAERDQLSAERAQLASQLATLTTDHNAALTQITTLQSQLAAAQELAEQLPSVTAERDAALGQVTTLEAQVSDLQAQLNPPANVRHLPPFSFYRRFNQDERFAIVTRMQTDPQVALIMTMLQTVRYVNLDDNDTQLGIGYLVQTGLITEERSAQVLADATPDEL